MSRMPALIVILEDNADRIAEMKACLADVLPRVTAIFFDSAQEMISWLPQNLANIVLISLDHDLPLRGRPGEVIEPRSDVGRQSLVSVRRLGYCDRAG